MRYLENELLWLTIFMCLASAVGLLDGPPSIISITTAIGSPFNLKVLREPVDFVVTGDTSDTPSRRNRLICKASNVDLLLWQYKKEQDGEWGELVVPMESGSQFPAAGGEKITLDVSDGDATKIEDLRKIDGYYRCVARHTSKGYETQSAPVRMVISNIKIGSVPPITPLIQPIANKPYTLPCITGTTELDPADAGEFTDVIYSWEMTAGGYSPLTYPVEDVNLPNRVRQDPKTGALYYAYVKSADAFADSSPDGDDLRFRCYATMGSQINVEMGDYRSLAVAANDDPVENVGVLLPETEMVDGVLTVIPNSYPSCIATTKCSVVIIFSGLYAANGTVVGKAPDGEEFQGGDYPGFQFIAKRSNSSAPVIYTATLYDMATLEPRLTVRVPIIVRHYPRLSVNAIFPPKQYVLSGTDVKLVCAASNANVDLTEFFINGVKVTDGNPSYVTRAFGNTLEVSNIGIDNSFSVQCVARNDLGKLYVNSIINVYDEPLLSIDPVVGLVAKDADSTSFYIIKCSLTFDHKITWTDFYWRTTRPDFLGRRVAVPGKGIAAVGRSWANHTSKVIVVILKLTPYTQNVLADTDWWCVVNYRVLDENATHTIESERMSFQLEKFKTTSDAPPTAMAGNLWKMMVVCVVAMVMRM